jgi:hypothetical protein
LKTLLTSELANIESNKDSFHRANHPPRDPLTSEAGILALRLLCPALRTHPAAALASRARPRLGLFSRHLVQRPAVELNTPFSFERSSSTTTEDAQIIADESRDILRKQIEHLRQKEKDSAEKAETLKAKAEEDRQKEVQEQKETPIDMSLQEPHPALLIPGPIEFEDAVLKSMSHFRYLILCCIDIRVLFLTLLQRGPYGTAICQCLWGHPHPASQAVPDNQSQFATIRHLWLRHLGLGPDCIQSD